MLRTPILALVPLAALACGGSQAPPPVEPSERRAEAASVPLPPAYPGSAAGETERKSWINAVRAYRGKYGTTPESSALLKRAMREWRSPPTVDRPGKPPGPLVNDLVTITKTGEFVGYGSALWTANGTLPGPLGVGLLEPGTSVDVVTVHCTKDQEQVNGTTVIECTATPAPSSGLGRLSDCMTVNFVEPTDDERVSIAGALKRSRHPVINPFAVTSPKPNRFYYVTTKQRGMVQEMKGAGCEGVQHPCDPHGMVPTGRVVPSTTKTQTLFTSNGLRIPLHMVVSPQVLDLSFVNFYRPEFVIHDPKRGKGHWATKTSPWSPADRSLDPTAQLRHVDRQVQGAAAVGDPTFTLLTTLNAALTHLKYGRLESARDAMAIVKKLRAQGHGSEPRFRVDKTLAAFADLVERKKWVLRDPCLDR